MKDGTASDTARSVAAHRLEFERVAADYGDPAADQSLTVDVADGREPTPGRMHEYLRARTAFFDRAWCSALERGVRQVVIGGAGYDGRALRYASPGGRWFEVDHPATQSDKVERVARLNVAPRISVSSRPISPPTRSRNRCSRPAWTRPARRCSSSRASPSTWNAPSSSASWLPSARSRPTAASSR